MAQITIALKRTGAVFSVTKNKETATGKWGKLTVDGVEYDSLERGGGYVTLPPGNYEVEMFISGKLQRNWSATEGKTLFVNNHKVFNSAGQWAGILIHPASSPFGLEGCIAPGKKNAGGDGLDDSLASMQAIFKAMGGWALGTKADLTVE